MFSVQRKRQIAEKIQAILRVRPRTYSYVRDVRACCRVCHGDYQWFWQSKNAQAIAARHFDSTGHETIVEIEMTLHYKKAEGKD